jgi:hypothetical protein
MVPSFSVAPTQVILFPTLVANRDTYIMVPTANSYLLAGYIPTKLTIYPDANHGLYIPLILTIKFTLSNADSVLTRVVTYFAPIYR